VNSQIYKCNERRLKLLKSAHKERNNTKIKDYLNERSKINVKKIAERLKFEYEKGSNDSHFLTSPTRFDQYVTFDIEVDKMSFVWYLNDDVEEDITDEGTVSFKDARDLTNKLKQVYAREV